jgi:hypothetical protein
MKKTAAQQSLLQLLVRVYNQSIQSYYHFPDVIICGHYRLEKAEFDMLLEGGYLQSYYVDSFGKLYHLSKKAEDILYQHAQKRKQKIVRLLAEERQPCLPFQ